MPDASSNEADGSGSGSGSVSVSDAEAKNCITAIQGLLPKGHSGGPYNREKLRDAAVKLSLALETPGDTVQRISYLPFQTTVVRIANTLDIFNILLKQKSVMTGKEIAQIVNADHLLIMRLLRYLVAVGAVKQAGPDSYAPNNITINLADPVMKAAVAHTFDLLDTAAMALPSFLARTEYRNPSSAKRCAFNDAFSTKDTMFEWFPKHPELLQDFNVWMTGQREGRTHWLDFFPLETQIFQGFQEGDRAVMLVDVGGAFGHEVEAIKIKYPKVAGKFILQDLPDTLSKAVKVSGMETMAYNFFTPQPVQGARAYYLRNILHDWPDDKCIEILTNTASAMTKGYSKILLNEVVMPDQGASLIAAQLDIAMMAASAGQERTESQFKVLAEAAGLKITKIWGEAPAIDFILELELK